MSTFHRSAKSSRLRLTIVSKPQLNIFKLRFARQLNGNGVKKAFLVATFCRISYVDIKSNKILLSCFVASSSW